MEKISPKCKSFIVGSMRKAWRFYSEARKECLKTRICVECNAKCKDIKADHIDPVGSFIPEQNPYIVRMFCDRSNLQGLCDKHHDIKTAKERALRKKLK